jgi:glycine/D-amino acid oxidase-like deaminating enzyme
MPTGSTSSAITPNSTIDAAIIGGGIAGTWALNLLRKHGYNVILLEADTLGAGQTLASQGMVHGGLKYALSGVLNGASEAIADMPRRWRACLEGKDDVDLRGAKLLSPTYYMFSADTALGRLRTFFASKALRGRIDKVNKADWPAEFRGFNGVVYLLNDFVLDIADLLQTLTREHADRIFSFKADGHNITPTITPAISPTGTPTGQGYDIHLQDITLHASQLISCAGNGSEALIKALGVPDIQVQQRPLKQVIVKPKHNVSLYGHCLTGITTNEPRLTITSSRRNGELVWYLGGQLADRGMQLSDDEQIATAKRELGICVPWLDWQDAEYSVLTVERAEPKQTSGLKPEQAYVVRQGNFIQCFPTKLTLAPDLGDRLLAVMDPPQNPDVFNTIQPLTTVGVAPW